MEMKMSWLIECVILLVLVSPCVAQSPNISVFILGGQSNMGGSGGLTKNGWDGVVPPECEPSPRILRLSRDMKWEEAREPLHKLIRNDSDNGYGVGPGMPLANYLLKNDPTIGVIGLVPCAIYGSYIRYWRRDGYYYSNMVARARAALAQGGVLRALLWYQGESDAYNRSDADAYRGRLVELFNNVRADLAAPKLLIIQVALASSGPFREKIREVQLHTELPNVKCVDAAGLPLNPDQLHLTTPAQVHLGSMLAQAYLTSATPPPWITANFSFSFMLLLYVVLFL